MAIEDHHAFCRKIIKLNGHFRYVNLPEGIPKGHFRADDDLPLEF